MKTPTPDFDERVSKMLCRVFKGLHHVSNLRKESAWTWRYYQHHGFSSFDFDELTRLVLGAHEYCLRVEIRAGGPRGLSVFISDRVRESESTYDRHPTIQQAIDRWEGK